MSAHVSTTLRRVDEHKYAKRVKLAQSVYGCLVSAYLLDLDLMA